MPDLADHLPPVSVDAEQAALGCALISARAATLLLSEVREDFYLEAHRRIYGAIATLAGQEPPVEADLLTVPEELRRRGQLDQVGGLAYFNQLAESVPTTAHAEHYLALVAEKAALRDLLDASLASAQEAHAAELPAAEIIDRAEARLYALQRTNSRRGLSELRPDLLEALERVELLAERGSHLTGLPTGFGKLDHLTAGLQPQNLIVVAGRPGTGKTALALGFSVCAARTGQDVLIFSLEMSRSELSQRLLAAEGRVDGTRLRTGSLSTLPDESGSGDLVRLYTAAGTLGDLPIYTCDAADLSAMELRGLCRRHRSQNPVGLVVVDYIQLVRGQGERSRVQEVGAVTRALKGLARELGCAVVALSQLSRDVEKRSDKRPVLSDLRESGDIEADADLVLMLYRPGSEQVEVNPTDLFIRKHRSGPCGTVELGFQNRFARFVDLAPEQAADEGEDEPFVAAGVDVEAPPVYDWN